MRGSREEGAGIRTPPRKITLYGFLWRISTLDPLFKVYPPLENVGPKSFYKMKEFELIIFTNINITNFYFCI